MRLTHFIKPILLLCLFTGIYTQLQAQIMVKGVVTDDQSVPIPGVNIIVESTQSGTITDFDGNYSIEVGSKEDVLVFSMVGMAKQKISVGTQTTINIKMLYDLVGLDEVAVIGYGTAKKSDLSSAVSIVTAEELTRSPVSSVSKALQGKASGVMVMQNGNPGGEVNIRIRGIGSINGDPDPLVVIDGIQGLDMSTVAPEDIASITVLKDASSTAIYGANGSNGVIVITTKEGKKSDLPKVSFSGKFSTQRMMKTFNLMNADEYANFYNNVMNDAGESLYPAFSNVYRQQYYQGDWNKGTDWQNAILQDNFSQNYYLNISNGSEKSNYSFSFNYVDDIGNLINSSNTNYSMRENANFNLNQYIKVGQTINMTRIHRKNSDDAAWAMALESSPLMNIYNEDNKGGYEGTQIPFDYIDENGDNATALNTGGNDKFNPVGYISLRDNNDYRDKIIANGYIEIIPIKGFSFKSIVGIAANFNQTDNWTPAYDMGVRSSNTAKLEHNEGRSQKLTATNQLSYDNVWGKHKVNAIVVHDVSVGSSSNMEGTGLGYEYEQLTTLSWANDASVSQRESGEAQLSYLGRVMYNYDSKYLFSASVRRDGSSSFAPGYKWGTFPAFSFGWKINEDFLTNVHQIDMLKLRVGWGQTGNSKPAGTFGYANVIGSSELFRPVFGEGQHAVTAMQEKLNGAVANPTIQWERSEMTNIGLDINAFKNKIQLSAEYYYKKDDQLIMEVPISLRYGKGMVGNPIYPKMNVADVVNKGFEFDIRYNKQEGEFNYKLYANMATINNKVTYIPSVITNDYNITKEGATIGSLYGFQAIGIAQESDFDADGNFLHATSNPNIKPGDLMFADLNGDGKITDDEDRMILGKVVPDISYSLGFNCAYKHFDFSLDLVGMHNFQLYNKSGSELSTFISQDMNENKSVEWTSNYYGKKGNPSTEYVRADLYDENRNSRMSSWWVEDASFLRFNDLQIGYTIPNNILKKVGITSTRVYLSGMNLFTLTKYSGIDPEAPMNSNNPTEIGIDKAKYPSQRTFTFGFQINI